MTDPVLRHAETAYLLDRLYRALDAGDPDRLAGCFAPDAVWHRPDGPKQGDAAIRAVAADRPANRTTTHIPTNIGIELDGEALIASYYLTVYVAMKEQPPRLLACLDCTDRLVITSGGLRVLEKNTRTRMQFG